MRRSANCFTFGSIALFTAVALSSSAAQTPKANKNAKPFIDKKADALLERVANKVRKAHSISGTMVSTSSAPDVDFGGTLTIHAEDIFFAQKPNLFFHETRSETGGPNGKRILAPFVKAISDGKKGMSFHYMDGSYTPFAISEDALIDNFDGYKEFFAQSDAKLRQLRENEAGEGSKLVSLRFVSSKKINGVLCVGVAQKYVNYDKEMGGRTTITTYVDQNAIAKSYNVEEVSLDKSLTIKVSAVVSQIAFDRDIPLSKFAIDTAGFKQQKPIVIPHKKEYKVDKPIDFSAPIPHKPNQ